MMDEDENVGDRDPPSIALGTSNVHGCAGCKFRRRAALGEALGISDERCAGDIPHGAAVALIG